MSSPGADQIRNGEETLPVAVFALSLVMLLSVVRLGSSLFLPALPAMGHGLGLTDTELSSIMTVYFAGFGVFALFTGPLSDAFGRRRVIFIGIAISLAGTLLCGVATGIVVMMAGRVLQAVGGSGIPVTTRAMVRDVCDDRQTISVMGWMGIFNSVVPIVAPVAGGFITEHIGWRANFHLLALVTAVIAIASYRYVPETLEKTSRVPFGVASIVRSYAGMLGTPAFMLVLTPLILCFLLQGVYLAMAPFVFVRVLRMSPSSFGLTGILLMLGLVAGRYVCVFLLKLMPEDRVFVVSGVLAFAAGPVFLAANRLAGETAFSVLASTVVFCLGFGCMLPLGIKSILTMFPRQRGAASALHNSLTLGASAVGSAASGFMLTNPSREIPDLCAATLVCGVLVLISALAARRYLR